MASGKNIISLDPFAHRQFDEKNGKGVQIEGCTKEDFIKKVNEAYEIELADKGQVLLDGYAPFCKHLFVPNFTSTKSAFVKITEENRPFIVSEYKARRPDELPVLTRWLPRQKVKVTKAKYLDLILYSREQINKENKAMGVTNPDKSPWGIVSIKPQDVDYETPMAPITMMRNALPLREGGSGETLNRNKYNEAVSFWKEHANVL